MHEQSTFEFDAPPQATEPQLAQQPLEASWRVRRSIAEPPRVDADYQTRMGGPDQGLITA